jgi:hypothetical protein
MRMVRPRLIFAFTLASAHPFHVFMLYGSHVPALIRARIAGPANSSARIASPILTPTTPAWYASIDPCLAQ